MIQYRFATPPPKNPEQKSFRFTICGTNKHFTVKENPLKRRDLNNFVSEIGLADEARSCFDSSKAIAMAFSKSFERELDNLFGRRTHWLRQEVGQKGAGKPPQFSRRNVNEGIAKLQLIASDALSDQLAKDEFDTHVRYRKNYHIAGRGVAEKKKRFEQWFKRDFANTRGLIYAFWDSSRQCEYVGKTGSGGQRPSAHFEKFWFNRVKRVTIYDVSRKSHIPKLECLAIHRLRPKRNKNKAATKKWTKACPLCTTHKYIESDLRSLFRFKRR
jgi:hypothetical protein